MYVDPRRGEYAESPEALQCGNQARRTRFDKIFEHGRRQHRKIRLRERSRFEERIVTKEIVRRTHFGNDREHVQTSEDQHERRRVRQVPHVVHGRPEAGVEFSPDRRLRHRYELVEELERFEYRFISQVCEKSRVVIAIACERSGGDVRKKARHGRDGPQRKTAVIRRADAENARTLLSPKK